jgi:hypothetical protein
MVFSASFAVANPAGSFSLAARHYCDATHIPSRTLYYKSRCAASTIKLALST